MTAGGSVAGRVHYEVFGRRKPRSNWTLEMATEDRAGATSCAHGLIEDDGFVAAKVTKEVLEEESGLFRSVSILNLGDWERGAASGPEKEPEPLCVTPQDLYTAHARERIGELLEDWLARHRVTAFELLHRYDLVERLEASGEEMLHAIQKIAVPEATARGCSVHTLMRAFQSLTERAIERLARDHRRGVLLGVTRETFAGAAERALTESEPGYVLGGAVAGALASAKTWNERVHRLVDLAEGAPADGPARALALGVLEQPLAEILGSRPGLEELIGPGLDLGGELAALTRLTASNVVDLLIRHEPSVAGVMTQLRPEAERLGRWFTDENFADVRTALGKRILRELNGPRRLRPQDAGGEIDVLRGLAMCLTAAAGKLLPLEDVQAAFSTRSKMLVTGDFVGAYLGSGRTAYGEAHALVWLCENVIGASNKRQASRWLAGAIGALRFETELSRSDESAAGRLAKLAELQRQVGRCGLAEEDAAPIQARLGAMGAAIESQARLTAAVAKARAPVVTRLLLLLRLAAGHSAPFGGAADRARAEAVRLLRLPGTREELSASPDQISTVRDLIQEAGLTA
jgi:hypothetical protein